LFGTHHLQWFAWRTSFIVPIQTIKQRIHESNEVFGLKRVFFQCITSRNINKIFFKCFGASLCNQYINAWIIVHYFCPAQPSENNRNFVQLGGKSYFLRKYSKADPTSVDPLFA
jgi:hypothetical protein